MSDEQESPKQKILFELEMAEHHDFSAETLWTEIIGHNKYRLLNIPLYVYGVSFGDIVEALHVDQEASFPVFTRVVEQAGHSTYRVFVFESAVDNPEFNQYWQPLEALGCAFEGQAGNKMLAVDVLPSANIDEVLKLLYAGENAMVWGFEEGNCVHVGQKS